MDHVAFIRLIRALADGEEAFVAALQSTPDFDGQAFIDEVARHKLLDWVAPACAHARVRPRLPEAFPASLAAYQADRRGKEAVLRQQSVELLDALQRASVPHLHLKGLSYVVRYYGGAARRWQRDVDILVRPVHREAATAALVGLGYVPEDKRIGDGAVRQGFLRGWADVDLHWNLRRRSRRHVGAEELWSGTQLYALDGREYTTLSDEYTLTFALLGMVGDLRRGACQARHFLDLYLMLRRIEAGLDWEEFFARRAPQSLAKPCVNVLALFLAVWRVGQQFPRLARALERRRGLVEIADEREAVHVVQQPRGDGVNQLWFRRVYPYDALADWSRRLSVDLPRTLSRLGPARSFRLGDG